MVGYWVVFLMVDMVGWWVVFLMLDMVGWWVVFLMMDMVGWWVVFLMWDMVVWWVVFLRVDMVRWWVVFLRVDMVRWWVVFLRVDMVGWWVVFLRVDMVGCKLVKQPDHGGGRRRVPVQAEERAGLRPGRGAAGGLWCRRTGPARHAACGPEAVSSAAGCWPGTAPSNNAAKVIAYSVHYMKAEGALCGPGLPVKHEHTRSTKSSSARHDALPHRRPGARADYTFYIVAYMPMGASCMSDPVVGKTLEDVPLRP
ncbi:unnamed protein product [Boreogadus saida]